ncbi:hypothetical protein [Listeria booriae]|uniref:DUF3139 domain-containing protein n=1 Tax=Listeria booriae TaxID=1552123 RepID=A0A7X0XHW5_9LIST|nr:hypothetical protein [Listeria booriae]MBC1561346.1 hypothetical protein [Listeria booriae]
MKTTNRFWPIAAFLVFCAIGIPAIIVAINTQRAESAINQYITDYGIPETEVVTISPTSYDLKFGGYNKTITTKKDMARWKAYLENPKNEALNYYYVGDVRKKKNTNSSADTDWSYIFHYQDGKVDASVNVFGTWVDPNDSNTKEFSSRMSYQAPVWVNK